MRIKSVNIVDETSNLQHILSVLRVRDIGGSSTTVPSVDTSLRKAPVDRINMGETLQRALEADGTQLLDVPGEAHEQVGRVEVYGRYSETMLARLRFGQNLGRVARMHPPDHGSQELLTRRCGCSPFQIAIGRDPELPGDLLQDLPNVTSSSSILHDDVAAHTARIRSNARLAVLQFNDNLATRRALDQRH